MPTISSANGASGSRATSYSEAAIKLRIITAAVALPLLILLIVKGSSFLFTLFIALASFIGLMEYCRMANPGKIAQGLLIASAGTVVPFLFHSRSAALTTLVITLFILGIAIHTLFSFKDITGAAAEVAVLFFGVMYIPYLLSYLVLLRGHPLGCSWILLIMCIVMCGDSAAYFVGCSCGKRRLYPEVSPKKSVEGAVGGLAGSIVGAIAAKLLFFPELSLADGVVMAVLIGALGQVGDLFESLLKRSFGVKDSGTIFPGHGGILDRLDSILFASPAAYYYALFISGRFFN